MTALALGVLAAGVLALATFQPVLRKIVLAGVVALVLIKAIQLVKRKREGKQLLVLEPTIAHFLEAMQKLIYRQDQRQKAITAQKCARASDHS